MVDLIYYLKSLFFSFSLLRYYIILKSSIICCPFSVDIHISFGVSIGFHSSVSESVSELFYGEFSVILLAILLQIKSAVSAAVIRIALFEAVLVTSVADCLAWLRSF